MPQTKSVIKGKTVQDTTLSSIFLVGFGTFREKDYRVVYPSGCVQCYVPIIFPKLKRKDLD